MKIPILIAPSTRLKRTGFSMLFSSNAPIPLVPRTGATRKSPKPSASAKTSVPVISFFERSSSSPSAMLVESVSAFMPSQRVSPRERAPRIIGSLKSLLRRVIERKRSALRSTSPAGVRTAIPQKLGERIRTPSIMACPPTLKVRPLLPVLAGLAPTFEPLHPAAGVHDATLARIERVAHRADVYRDGLARRRTRLELRVAARTPHQRLSVIGMYPRLHAKPPSLSSISLLLIPGLAAARAGTRRWCGSP